MVFTSNCGAVDFVVTIPLCYLYPRGVSGEPCCQAFTRTSGATTSEWQGAVGRCMLSNHRLLIRDVEQAFEGEAHDGATANE